MGKQAATSNSSANSTRKASSSPLASCWRRCIPGKTSRQHSLMSTIVDIESTTVTPQALKLFSPRFPFGLSSSSGQCAYFSYPWYACRNPLRTRSARFLHSVCCAAPPTGFLPLPDPGAGRGAAGFFAYLSSISGVQSSGARGPSGICARMRYSTHSTPTMTIMSTRGRLRAHDPVSVAAHGIFRRGCDEVGIGSIVSCGVRRGRGVACANSLRHARRGFDVSAATVDCQLAHCAQIQSKRTSGKTLEEEEILFIERNQGVHACYTAMRMKRSQLWDGRLS